MTDLERWLSDAEIQQSKLIATRDPSNKQRHHFVPQMYLKRWLEPNGQNIQYKNFETGKGGFGSPKTVGFLPYFYRYDSIGEPELWVETHLGRIENDGAMLLRMLDSMADGEVTNPRTVRDLAIYVGLQSQRTPRVREINTAVENWNPTGKSVQTAAIDLAISTWRGMVVSHLSTGRRWWLASTSSPLMTCDEPIIHIGYPGWTRKKRLSLATTSMLVFPISPYRLLIAAARNDHVDVVPPFTLAPAEVDEINLEITANCLKVTYEQESTRIAAGLSIPSAVPNPDIDSDNIFKKTNHQTRWAGLEAPPPWPLSRWVRSMPLILQDFAKLFGY
ncbi:DUF4238 domain-containing protein [Nocardia sp. NBC_01503]|uniref:DUF4238 domain-containing protein n=1 Tax=Nocardia sp. NBC_01503 TaxID=2975997 RepID=UPI002E7C5618|nr:DUF4238 domain-containing protein [Nocardia sp. NBC_01503]WTL29239.1 DUF4238 domain-containing protein [Nocardia sp. NBC_01503]